MQDVNGLGGGLTPAKVVFAWSHVSSDTENQALQGDPKVSPDIVGPWIEYVFSDTCDIYRCAGVAQYLRDLRRLWLASVSSDCQGNQRYYLVPKAVRFLKDAFGRRR
jgi:hypothetical protein